MSNAPQSTLTINDMEELNDADFGGEVAPPDQYQDPIGPRPLDEATYTMKITNIAKDADKEGNWRDTKFPGLKIDLEVTEGERTGRKANFLRISSRSYPRGAAQTKASELGDLIRGFDPHFNWQGSVVMAINFLREQCDKGNTFKVRLGWTAFDKDNFMANGGDSMARGSEELKALYKASTIKGQRNFLEDGTVVGPSGKLLKAQSCLLQVMPAKGV